ncbi:MAG: hypothetical protein ACPGLV_03010 [Bacteroidia bacterium]
MHLLENYFLRISIFTLFFALIGLFISIWFTRLLHKKKWLKRKPKAYHYGIKLVYPYTFAVSLYFLSIIGLIQGVKSSIKNDANTLGTVVYENTVALSFENDSSKNEALKSLATAVKSIQATNKASKVMMQRIAQELHFESKLLESSKNVTANFIIKHFGDEIFARTLYYTLMLTPKNDFVEFEMNYDEYEKAINNLLALDASQIEASLIENIGIAMYKVIKPQLNGIIITQVLIWVVLMALPFIEIILYKKLTKNQEKVA